jgi:hypothetical protein
MQAHFQAPDQTIVNFDVDPSELRESLLKGPPVAHTFTDDKGIEYRLALYGVMENHAYYRLLK